MMTNDLVELHLNAAIKAGKEASCCGTKIWYSTYDVAYKAALRLNGSGTAHHIVESYPCPFCCHWHIGREMSEEELKSGLTRSMDVV